MRGLLLFEWHFPPKILVNKIPLALTRGNIKFPRGNINLEFLRVVPGLRVWECLRYTVQGSGLRVQVELLGYATAKLENLKATDQGLQVPPQLSKHIRCNTHAKGTLLTADT